MKFQPYNQKSGPLSEEEAEQLPLPLDLFEPKREVRPEYNIGKFAGVIFTSPYAKNVKEVRTYNWEVTNGSQSVEASLTITPLVGLKTPTTTTLRVFLALLQVWENMGQPADGIVPFSARQLCAVIGWRWGGSDTADRIYNHLKVLSGTNLNWVLAYTQKGGVVDELYSDMSILQSADYRKRKQLFEPEKYSIVQKVRFNSDLVENMLAGHVRPLNYEAFRQIGNDTTANLYMRLDLYLHSKPKWERRAFELLTDELGLNGRRYQARRTRHAKLKDFVRELDGVALFSGKLRLSIEETADGKDWKLVARKEAGLALVKPKRPHLLEVMSKEDAEVRAEDLIETIMTQPRPGTPHRLFITLLFRYYPADLIYRALSIAKADYFGQVRTTLTQVFIYEVQRLVEESGKYKWYKDKPLKRPSWLPDSSGKGL